MAPAPIRDFSIPNILSNNIFSGSDNGGFIANTQSLSNFNSSFGVGDLSGGFDNSFNTGFNGFDRISSQRPLALGEIAPGLVVANPREVQRLVNRQNSVNETRAFDHYLRTEAGPLATLTGESVLAIERFGNSLGSGIAEPFNIAEDIAGTFAGDLRARSSTIQSLARIFHAFRREALLPTEEIVKSFRGKAYEVHYRRRVFYTLRIVDRNITQPRKGLGRRSRNA